MTFLKKALVEIGLLEWIGVILAIVLIIGTAYFFGSMAGIWGDGGQREEGTITNFRLLAHTINEMMDINTECVYTVDHAFSIDDSHIVVGFNKDRGFVEDACQYEAVFKPGVDACIDSACLGLYRNPTGTDDDFVDNPQMFCEALKSKTGGAADYVFTRRYYLSTPDIIASKSKVLFNAPENIYKNFMGMPWGPPSEYGALMFPYTWYSYLLIYGECGDWGSNEDFRSSPLYIEVLRTQKAGKIAVFIAPSTTELIKERKAVHASNKLSCTEY